MPIFLAITPVRMTLVSYRGRTDPFRPACQPKFLMHRPVRAEPFPKEGRRGTQPRQIGVRYPDVLQPAPEGRSPKLKRA